MEKQGRAYALKTVLYWQVMLQTAKFVRQEGGQLELVLRVRQGQNASFAFLKPDGPLHDYYRWLVHAEPQVCGSRLSGPSPASYTCTSHEISVKALCAFYKCQRKLKSRHETL